MKKLFLSACMLLLAAVLLGTTTYAWFSMNRKVEATGFNVKATVDSSLVVTRGGVTSAALPNKNTETTSIDFTEKDKDEEVIYTDLYQSTRTKDFETGLKTLTDETLANIQSGTGLTEKNGENDYSYAPITGNTSEKTYYIDYIIYVAAQGKKLENQDLTIELTGIPTSVKDVNKALSVAVYMIDSVVTTAVDPVIDNTKTASDKVDNWASYKGVLNVAGLDADANDAKTTKTSITLESITVPYVGTGDSGDGALAFLFRVYVDGALLKTLGDSTTTPKKPAETFLQTADVLDVADMSIGIKITALDHVAE